MNYPSKLVYDYFAERIVRMGVPEHGQVHPFLAVVAIAEGQIKSVQPVADQEDIWYATNVREVLDVASAALLAHPVAKGTVLGIAMFYEAHIHVLEGIPTEAHAALMNQHGFDTQLANDQLQRVVMLEVRHREGNELGWLPIHRNGKISYRELQPNVDSVLDASIDAPPITFETVH